MSLKILHTADWHLGKKLYDYSLADDHRLFFIDLIRIIEKHEVDYLLISGDVFDLSHPSNESLELYYSFITKLIPTGCRLIVTGGNHDSPGVLNAPKNILNFFRIHVVGCVTPEREQQIITLFDKDEKPAAVVAAVPFLRDRDIRIAVEGSTTAERITDIRNGIKKHYSELADLCAQKHNGLTAIAMGHLFTQNAQVSESEREIQIGNLAGVDASCFPDVFKYVALGHIHKPQNVSDDKRIRYSGSPVPLSFSEKNYSRRVILLTINDKRIEQEDISLPPHRKLDVIEGSLEKVRSFIQDFRNELTLPSLLELRITEKEYDPEVLRAKDELNDLLKQNTNAQIIQYKVSFINNIEETINKHDQENLGDLDPAIIWESLIGEFNDDQRGELLSAFHEIMNAVQNRSES
jgi:DNA repair protein SbcD/Mre11